MTAKGIIVRALALAAIAPTGVALASTPVLSGGRATQAPVAPAPADETTPAIPTTPATPTTPAEAPPAKPTAHTRITKLPKATISDATAPLRVRLSAPPAPDSPVPMLSPAAAGKWTIMGNYESFTPKSTLEPCSTYTLTVWAKTTATERLPLGKRRTLTLHVACPSTLALQQSLARLGYLPYTLHARYNQNSGDGPETRSVAARYLYHPPEGPFKPNVPHAPGLSYANMDATTRGAVMVFQSVHGLSPTGVPDDATWASLLAAGTLGHDDPRPYTFVTVSESIPETLEVHRGHHVVLTTPVNTGVAGAETERGTFPIYSRFTSTTMTGTNPDGSHYSDPGVPWVSYFKGGDAVHGFPRPSYGSPQSNGCVELPFGTAARVYPLLAIGDLVIVS
jgi:peptidoglycan hydrolase-like protein with peptidoglycan-binding domain